MTLRDRKRARIRQALVDAATELFERDGYDETTVADIAAAADIGTRTFFSYFASKEELLFPESDARVRAAVEAIAARGPDEGPAEVLLRALHQSRRRQRRPAEPAGRAAAAADPEVPAVRGRGAADPAGRAARDRAAAGGGVPRQLDEVRAAALDRRVRRRGHGGAAGVAAGPGPARRPGRRCRRRCDEATDVGADAVARAAGTGGGSVPVRGGTPVRRRRRLIFMLSFDVGVHAASMARSDERAVAGVRAAA